MGFRRVPVLLALVAVAACSGGGGSSAVPSLTVSALETPSGELPSNAASTALSAKLLVDTDFPPGWAGGPADPAATVLRSADPGCTSAPPVTDPLGSAAAVFNHTTDGLVDDSISESLDSLPSTADATSAFAAQKAYLVSCSTLVFDGTSLKTRSLTLTKAGDESTAVQLTGMVGTDPITVDLAFARRGSVLVRLAHVGGMTVNSVLTQTQLVAAADHLPA